MDRQRLALALALAALVGCRQEIPGERLLAMPVGATVLDPEVGGPFEEPIGIVASGLDGQIGLAALKQGRWLTDDPTAAFLPANQLATGGARLLSDVAVYSTGRDHAEVIAADKAWKQLVRVPWFRELDDRGFPIEPEPTANQAVFVDDDGSGSTGELGGIVLKHGFTSTEDWSIEYDGSRWWVTGSRSGRQETTARTGRRYLADKQRLSFVIKGSGFTLGDRFEVSTDNGITEHDIGGLPLKLSMSPDQSRLAVLVHDDLLDAPVVRWVDPATGDVTGDLALPAGARPLNIDWRPDGQTLFVADGALSAAHEVQVDSGDTVISHPLPWPITDATSLYSDRRRLFVAPANENAVYMVDLDTDELIDINPWLEGVQGMQLLSPVSGLQAMYIPYLLAESDPDEVRLWGRSVAVAQHSGRLVFMEEETGCLVQDALGPRTLPSSSFGTAIDYETNFEDVTAGPFLEIQPDNDRSVQINGCGGIAKQQTWVLRYSVVQQAWEVRGTISGDQQRLAFEDQRYVSDNGEISFTMRAGPAPSQENMIVQFTVQEGVISADGINHLDGVREVELEMPGDPIYFHYRVGPTSGGWKKIDDRPFVLVLSEASDMALRVKPQDGKLEIVWD